MKNLIAERTAMVAGFMAFALIVMTTTGNMLRQSSADEPTLVQIDSGKVQGTETNGVIAFKGIPFAQPPVGALRWRAPQPVKPWEGVRDATEFGPDAVQPPDLVPPGARISEDCLYLNVWRPVSASDDPLPVMVWIYGGGFVKGGAVLYPREALARQGIVIVTFNYRLGRLGFFAHPALAREAPRDLRGNYGGLSERSKLARV